MRVYITILVLSFAALVAIPVAGADPLVRALQDLGEASDEFVGRVEVAPDAPSVVAAFDVFNGRLAEIMPRLRTARLISPYGSVESVTELPAELQLIVRAGAESVNRLAGELAELLRPYENNEAVLHAWNRMGSLMGFGDTTGD